MSRIGNMAVKITCMDEECEYFGKPYVYKGYGFPVCQSVPTKIGHKTIKVGDACHKRLADMKLTGETFEDVIERMFENIGVDKR